MKSSFKQFHMMVNTSVVLEKKKLKEIICVLSYHTSSILLFFVKISKDVVTVIKVNGQKKQHEQ